MVTRSRNRKTEKIEGDFDEIPEFRYLLQFFFVQTC